MAKVYLLYFDLHTGYYQSFHHGLAYLMGMLKQKGHAVTLQHMKAESDYENVLRSLKQEKPDVMGLSFTSNQIQYVRRFLKEAGALQGLIIGGGVHCTLLKEKIFAELPPIQGICIGEGELPLAELCRRIDAKEDYLQTPGFCFNTPGGIIKNDAPPLSDIDALPLPDYSLFNQREVVVDSGGWFPMMVSRGCPYNCYYCCNHALREAHHDKARSVRFASVPKAVEIIKHNLNACPAAEKISFSDDTFTLDKKWLVSFCDLYKKEINMPFLCNARPEAFDEVVAGTLKEAGCTYVCFGVESGNPWLRTHVLNRTYSNELITKVFGVAQQYNLKTFSYTMLGLPFETESMQKDTLRLNFSVRPYAGKCFYFYPYPETRLYALCVEYGLLCDDFESKSGYLEGPCLREVFVSHAETVRNYQKLQLFFYAQIIFSKVKIPVFLQKSILAIVFLLRQPLFFCCDSTNKFRTVKAIRQFFRTIILKHMR